MILAHGGMSYEMISYIVGGFLLFIVILVWLHLYARKTRFYQNEFLTYGTPGKIIIYCLFLSAACLAAYLISFLLLIIVARMLKG